jgi:hypothetical protein
MTLFSAVESARFGWRIGRLDLKASAASGAARGSGSAGATGSAGAAGAPGAAAAVAVAEAFERDRLDILIVRTAADDLVTPGVLASLPDLRSLPAGTLLYWDWRGDGDPQVDDETADSTDDPHLIEHLARAVFDGYSNHYAANPLLSPERTVDGYCEWATELVASGKASCLTSSRADPAGPIGLAVVDWTADPPDIRLAGILPERRGRGSYRRLIELVMAESVRRGYGAVQISTQAHNTQVMRAWADLGWRPRRAIATTHIVPEALLRSSRTPAR